MIFKDCPSQMLGMVRLGRETLAVTDTSKSLAAIPAASVGDVEIVMVSIEGADARMDLVADPTIDIGIYMEDKSTWYISGEDIVTVEFIREATTDLTLDAIYFGRAI